MYEQIEEALRARLIAHFPEMLSENRVVKGDLDSLFDNILSDGTPYGVLVDYAYGERLRHPPFNGKVWSWTIECYFLVRYQGDTTAIEESTRAVIDHLYSLLDAPNHILGGTTPNATVTAIARPEPTKVNDVPFMWVPFRIEALDKG